MDNTNELIELFNYLQQFVSVHALAMAELGIVAFVVVLFAIFLERSRYSNIWN